MEKIYLVCDWCDNKAASIDGAPDIGVEYMGRCSGRAVREDGSQIYEHCSSSIGWLRCDLINNLDNPDKYIIIDLLNEPVPDRFKLSK